MRVGLFKSTSSAGRPKAGQSNIRGKVISGPIPIPDIADDDEFPMRQPGTGLATTLGHEAPSKLQVQPEAASTVETQSTSGTNPEVKAEERTETPQRAGTRQASDSSGSPAQGRTNSTLRYSTVSSGTDRSQGTPRRKKSGLRTTLSKLFGRKKSPPSLETHPEVPTGSAQHRSDPSALGRVLTRESEPKRSASLPITEFDRALRSHSIGPDDILAIESARNSLTGEPIRFRRRAATTSSRLYIRRSRELNELIGLSPRPASTHGRTAPDDLDQSDPENIGRAITSDVSMHHRRSRSLSQLRTVAEGPTHRNRQDEIRYWRESYDPGFQSPTVSSAAVDNDHDIGNDNDDTGHITLDMPEPPMPQEPKTPPQPFNFGPLVGMKITQAASLEERVAALETRNDKLERLVQQLFEVVPGVRSYQEAARQRGDSQATAPSTTYTSFTLAPAICTTAPHMEQSSTRYSSSRHSNDSFGDGVTFIGSIPPAPAPLHRPTSTATVRGTSSLPTLAREPLSDDRYTTLMNLLETERAARQYLEAQVTRLTQKLDLVARTTHKIDPLADPTRMAYSVFDHDDEEEDSDVTGNGRDDQSMSEAFETPREEYPKHGYGAFGEELTDEDADGSRKKAARTLSLSQLTLGKPKRPPTTESGVEL